MQCNNARLLTGDMYAASVNNSLAPFKYNSE